MAKHIKVDIIWEGTDWDTYMNYQNRACDQKNFVNILQRKTSLLNAPQTMKKKSIAG